MQGSQACDSVFATMAKSHMAGCPVDPATYTPYFITHVENVIRDITPTGVRVEVPFTPAEVEHCLTSHATGAPLRRAAALARLHTTLYNTGDVGPDEFGIIGDESSAAASPAERRRNAAAMLQLSRRSERESDQVCAEVDGAPSLWAFTDPSMLSFYGFLPATVPRSDWADLCPVDEE